MIDFEDRYAPRTLADVVFADAQAEHMIRDYEQGRNSRPLLLFGGYGTGKSTIAALLPKAIAPDIQQLDIRKLDAGKDRSVNQIRNNVDAFTRVTAFNSSYRRFVVLDEADGLTADAQQALRGIMDQRKHCCMFILTTNHFHEIDGSILSRCTCLSINPAPAQRWLPRARMILQMEGYPQPDRKLLPLIRAAQGDNRRVLANLQSFVSRLKAGVAKTSAPVSATAAVLSAQDQE